MPGGNRFPLSINVNGNHSDLDAAERFLLAIQPEALTVVHNTDWALHMHHALGGRTRVVNRLWSPREQLEWLVSVDSGFQPRNPDDYVNWIAGYPSAYDVLYHHIAANEPGWPGDVTRRHYNDFCADIIERLKARGAQLGRTFRVCALNYGIGRFEREHVQAGDFDRILRLAAGDETILLGSHDYAAGLLWYGLDPRLSRDAFADPNHPLLQPPQWPTGEWAEAFYEQSYQAMWLCYRATQWWNSRCRELHIVPPLVVSTEYGMDDVDEGLKQILLNTYGTDYLQGIRGEDTYRRAYARIYPDRTFAEIYALQLRRMLELAPANHIGLCHFYWTNDEWAHQFGNKFMQNVPLQDAVIAMSEAYRRGEIRTMTYPIERTWTRLQVEPAGGYPVNVRDAPAGDVIAQIPEGGGTYEADVAATVEAPLAGFDYTWMAIRKPGEWSGWVARDVVRYTEVASPPVDLYLQWPPPEAAEQPEEWLEFAAALRWLAQMPHATGAWSRFVIYAEFLATAIESVVDNQNNP